MVVNCAVMHHCKRCFVFEEQQGDIRMKFRYAGFWWMGLCLSLRRNWDTRRVFHSVVWDCLQVVQSLRSVHSVLGRGIWAHYLLTDLPALLSFPRADLKHRFEMVLKSDGYKECCMDFLWPHISSYPPKQSHNFRLCRSVLKLTLSNSCKVVERRGFIYTHLNETAVCWTYDLNQFPTPARPKNCTS